jgi:23S rRNA-intervening sequence protein
MGQDYQDLLVWQRAIEMTVSTYEATRTFPREEMYGLTSQLRRAAVSVASNIAEGRGRISQGEFRQFLDSPKDRITRFRFSCWSRSGFAWASLNF